MSLQNCNYFLMHHLLMHHQLCTRHVKKTTKTQWHFNAYRSRLYPQQQQLTLLLLANLPEYSAPCTASKWRCRPHPSDSGNVGPQVRRLCCGKRCDRFGVTCTTTITMTLIGFILVAMTCVKAGGGNSISGIYQVPLYLGSTFAHGGNMVDLYQTGEPGYYTLLTRLHSNCW